MSGALRSAIRKVISSMAVAKRPRYAIYTRISRDPTGTSTAPARQEKDCRRLARERGWDVVEVYSDSDLSGWRNVTRPGYEAMLTAMAAGTIDGVIVWKLDRLMRRITEFSRFWAVAEANGVALVSKHDPVDTTTPLGLAVVYLIVALAEQESRNTSLRMKAREQEKAERGLHKAEGRRSFGIAEGWAELVPDEADVIRDMAAQLLAGTSPGAVARDLNERGITTLTGGPWRRQSVAQLMRSARLFGWRERHGELVAPGHWPAILDEDTGRKLRALLGPKPPSRGGTVQRKYLLSGLLRCGKCGQSLKGGGRDRSHYVCATTDMGGCRGTSIDRHDTDQAVVAMVLHRLNTPAVLDQLAAQAAGPAVDDAAILGELAQLVARGQELAAMWAAGELARKPWLDAQRELDRRQEDLNRQLAAARRPTAALRLAEDPSGIEHAWGALTQVRQRAVLEALIDRITVLNLGSPELADRLRPALLVEADEAEAAGNKPLARRRRAAAVNPSGRGLGFRPERIEVAWRV